jgi:hypothetical protein
MQQSWRTASGALLWEAARSPREIGWPVRLAGWPIRSPRP